MCPRAGIDEDQWYSCPPTALWIRLELFMTTWQPHIDLARLLEALGEDIVATTQHEIKQACAEGGRSVRAEASEALRIIGMVTGDLDDPDAGVVLVDPTIRRELVAKQH
jgi:hypothetical protein